MKLKNQIMMTRHKNYKNKSIYNIVHACVQSYTMVLVCAWSKLYYIKHCSFFQTVDQIFLVIKPSLMAGAKIPHMLYRIF